MNIQKWCKNFRKELEFKGYASSTVESYVRCLWDFLADFEGIYSEPKAIPERVIREWLSQSQSIAVLKHRIGALKRFYTVIVRQPLKFKYIEYPRKEKRLPIILSREEVSELLRQCTNKKHRLILLVLYATGIRIGELLNLKLSDIDTANMVIHIMKGKGKKQRMAVLRPKLLEQISQYISEYKPKEFLFEGPSGGKYSPTSVNAIIKRCARNAGIAKKVSAHIFRHTSFTHSLEAGENLYLIQRKAGHNSPKTTSIYLHTSPEIIANSHSPIDDLNI